MKVLLLGSGGREYALYRKLCASPKLGAIHVFPGNGAIEPQDQVSQPIDLQ